MNLLIFFLKIRKELDSKHLYIPYDQVDVVFNEFTTVSEEYIRKTIIIGNAVKIVRVGYFAYKYS